MDILWGSARDPDGGAYLMKRAQHFMFIDLIHLRWMWGALLVGEGRAYSKELFELQNNSFPPFFPVSSLPLEVDPLNPSKGSGKHSPSKFWGRAANKIEFGAF